MAAGPAQSVSRFSAIVRAVSGAAGLRVGTETRARQSCRGVTANEQRQTGVLSDAANVGVRVVSALSERFMGLLERVRSRSVAANASATGGIGGNLVRA